MKLNDKIYNAYLSVIALITSLPILAPILLKLSENNQVFLWPARALYFVYSFTCHQFHHRSLYLFDYQFAWCARDTGIWLGILLAAIYIKRFKTGLNWYWLVPFIIPIALDGGIQTIATVLGIQTAYGVTGDILYVSNNLVRFMSGAFFGVGMGLIFSPMIYQLSSDLVAKISWQKQTLHIISMLGILVVIFAGSVQLWGLTSEINKPSDLLDTAVKTPVQGLFLRRQDGACPAEGTNPLSFNCK